MKTLGIILARSGSKGISFKNIYPCNGKPLVFYAIEAGLESQVLEKLVVVVDFESDKIKEKLKHSKYFGKIYILRVHQDDKTISVDVIREAVEKIENDFGRYDIIIELPCTNPLRTTEDVIRAYSGMIEFYNDIDSVVSVSRTINHPSRAKVIKDGLLKEYCDKCSFIRNGAVYITKRNVLEKSRFGSKILPYIMPLERSINIDTKFDLKLAELLLKERKGKINVFDRNLR